MLNIIGSCDKLALSSLRIHRFQRMDFSFPIYGHTSSGPMLRKKRCLFIEWSIEMFRKWILETSKKEVFEFCCSCSLPALPTRILSLQHLPCERCGTELPEVVIGETVKLAPEGHYKKWEPTVTPRGPPELPLLHLLPHWPGKAKVELWRILVEEYRVKVQKEFILGSIILDKSHSKGLRSSCLLLVCQTHF